MSKPERMMVYPLHGDEAIVDCPVCGKARGYPVSHIPPICPEGQAQFDPDALTLENLMEKEIMHLLTQEPKP